MRPVATSKVCALIVLAAISTYGNATSLPSNHPLLGTWHFEVPGTHCAETYTFKRDGFRTYRSATEVGKSKFVVSPKPDDSGYYTLTDTIVESNGKSACVGEASPVGDVVTLFIRFEDSADTFFICPAKVNDGCFGPFEKASTKH